MRYDTKVSLFNEGREIYNPRTHKHEKKNEKVLCQFCNVTDLGTQKQVELLGGLKEGSKTIRMIKKPKVQWTTAKIDGDERVYRFMSSLHVLKGYAMIVGVDNGTSSN